MNPRWSAVAVVLVCSAVAPLSADVLIVERMVLRTGDKSIEGVRSTYIKGNRMRLEVAQDGRTAITVYDLPAGDMIEFDTKKKRAYVRKVTARNAKLEKEYPRERTTVTVTPAGKTQTLAGHTCTDHDFDVRVPLTSNGAIMLTLEGYACLAQSATGVEDYQTFARLAHEQQLVLGPASDNYLLLAVARAQTELYRALTMSGGLPLIVDMTFDVEGRGIAASIARKVLSASRTSASAKFDAAPLADTLFTVPADWKREAKK